ncbi:type-2 ice-structuring protein-like isoform X1 [Xyrichtys novacula]|uniref:Type-2 ice-structuring protein-like isoform X1 n=1 Tax=Xyrichtys novacula TaxID=13765 RepID=A0AAV1GYL5_XYRNO|nr:type-2 ice-structuring protein-like isoform X1 [Xyrichtys novacula]
MKVLALCVLLCALMALTESEEVWKKIGSRSFAYISKKMSWDDAEQNCIQLGGHLASIRSSTEHIALKIMIKENANWNPHVWIGGTDSTENDVWRWTDGSPFKYSNWCPGEPNNFILNLSVQHCLQMNYSDRRCWDNVDCWYAIPSICAKG